MKRNKFKNITLTNLWNIFVEKMIFKLRSQSRSGWTGWDDEDEFPEEEVIKRIEQKLKEIKCGKRQEIDLANYAMFLYLKREEKS